MIWSVFKQHLWIFLILLNIFPDHSIGQTYSFSSCQDALTENKIICREPLKKNVLTKSWKDIEKVVQEIGYDDVQNPEDEFFLDIKKELIKTIRFNQTKMKLTKRCLNLLDFPEKSRATKVFEIFPDLKLKPSNSLGIVDKCERSIANLRNDIKDDFYKMLSGLSIGWSSITTTAPHSFVGITHDKNTKFETIGIPVTEKSKNHILSNHKVLLDPIKKRDLAEINEEMYYAMADNLIDVNLGVIDNLSDEAFLKSIRSLPFSQRIEKIKKRINKYNPESFTQNRKSSFNNRWDLRKKGPFQERYFNAIAATPLIAHLPNGEGRSEDLEEALSVFIENSDKFLKSLEPKSEDPIKLKHLANFNSVINQYLSRNLDKCDLAESWMSSKKEQEDIASKWQISRVGVLLVGCVGGGFFAQSGVAIGVAAATCTTAGGALAGYDIYQAAIEREQLVKETSLNATELLARDFETLNAAEKELYLNVALLPLELLGLKKVVDSSVVISKSIKEVAHLRSINQDLIKAFNKSDDVRFFKGKRELKISANDFKPGDSYTVLVRDGKLIIGKKILGEGDKLGGSGSHITLMRSLKEADPYDYRGYGGAIKFNAAGGIDVSGYHSKMNSSHARDRIVNLIRKVFPNVEIRETTGKLSKLPPLEEAAK